MIAEHGFCLIINDKVILWLPSSSGRTGAQSLRHSVHARPRGLPSASPLAAELPADPPVLPVPASLSRVPTLPRARAVPHARSRSPTRPTTLQSHSAVALASAWSSQPAWLRGGSWRHCPQPPSCLRPPAPSHPPAAYSPWSRPAAAGVCLGGSSRQPQSELPPGTPYVYLRTHPTLSPRLS